MRMVWVPLEVGHHIGGPYVFKALDRHHFKKKEENAYVYVKVIDIKFFTMSHQITLIVHHKMPFVCPLHGQTLICFKLNSPTMSTNLDI